VVTSKKTIPISGNLTFHVSPGSRFAVNDLYNPYLRLELKESFFIPKV
jgi:hypothetical protein